MPVRLDEIQPTFDSAIRLEDIPNSPLSPDEVEKIANNEFDYAEREKVSTREASKRIRQEAHDENLRRNMFELRKAGFDVGEIPGSPKQQGEIYQSPAISFAEGATGLKNLTERGILNVAKTPGIILKAFGESAPTPSERKAHQEQYGTTWLSQKLDNAALAVTESVRKAGNSYIKYFNDIQKDEPLSDEMQLALNQPFSKNPFLKTAATVAESAPSYGAAVASTLLTKNPNIGLAIIGTTSASQTYEQLRDEKIDPDLAMVGSVLVGTIEIATEKVPMDMLLRGGGKPFLKRALNLGTAEAFQELFAQMGQNYVAAAIKGVDPKDLSTVTDVARQEWSTIMSGWQESMAAGFVMGGGASVFTPKTDAGRTAKELSVTYSPEYAATQRNAQEFIDKLTKIRTQVQEISSAPEMQGEKEATLSVVAKTAEKGKVAGVEEATAQIEPVGVGEEAGKGEQKERGLSRSIEYQAIEKELTDTFGELPIYQTMNMKEQAEKALQFIESNYDAAKRVAMGFEDAPAGLYPENINTALRIHAVMNQDIQTMMDLAMSPESNRVATILGQRIKSLDTGEQSNPIKTIQDIVQSRTESLKRKGKDTTSLEVELKTLQSKLFDTEKKLKDYMNRAESKAKRNYGTQNKLISKDEYKKIIDRRTPIKEKLSGFLKEEGGYAPNEQDLKDIAKIGLYHLEALGRDFARWSANMVADFGEWIKPYIDEQWDVVLKQADEQGVEIKESKRLKAKKGRMKSLAKKYTEKLESIDLEKTQRLPIELDAEGKQLQQEYELAREKYRTAQKVASVITEEEVRTIAQMAKDVADKKAIMEKSERRKSGKTATDKELQYGLSQYLYNDYVQNLKLEAEKRTFSEIINEYMKNPLKTLADLGGISRTLVASFDNSFIGRQARKVFYRGLTGDKEAAKTWASTFGKSFKLIWDTFKKKHVMMALYADIISDPDYDLIRKSKTATAVIEEELPSDLPNRIPLLGILFRASENAFVGSAHYMRYRLAKAEIDVWRNAGKPMTKENLEQIGKLVNAQTGRGYLPAGQQPGFINNILWSPRNIKADLDFMVFHFLDPKMSAFAKKRAAINLLRYVTGAAAILALADMFDDDFVEWDARSADFGKIRIGNTRFSIGGGVESLIVLASRIASGKYKSSTTGEIKDTTTGKYGQLQSSDLVYNYLENKLSPASQFAKTLMDRRTREGEKPTAWGELYKMSTPLQIQTYFQDAPVEDRADMLSIMIAEFIGVNVQTYTGKKSDKKKESGRKRGGW